MGNHCANLKFDHPDKIAPGITEWIENNPILDQVVSVNQFTTMEPIAGGLQVATGQPNAKYVFNFIVVWTSKETADQSGRPPC